jgi:cobalt/nickel transport system permease protein
MSHEHHPDGRLRLLAALLVSVASTAITSIHTLAIMLLLALLASFFVIIRRTLSLRWLAKRIGVINVFVLWIWFAVAIDWRSLTPSDSGTALATQMTLRVNVIALAVSLLLGRMSGIDLARAVVGLGLPQSLGALIALAVRSVAILADTRTRLEQAMRARAYQSRFGWRTIRVSSQLVAWLIIHALVRSERLELGLRARGLSAMNYWPVRRHGHWNTLPRSEWLLLGSVAAAIAIAMMVSGSRG